MKLAVQRSTLQGRVAIPGSKSHTIRMVALAALAPGESEIAAPLVSADTLSAASTYTALGAPVDTSATTATATSAASDTTAATATTARWSVAGAAGRFTAPSNVLDVGNSGTTLRFALASAALLPAGAAVFTGDDQIRSRPNGPLLKSLNDLGAKAVSTRGTDRPPIVVQGRLAGGRTSMEVISSQYLSALLLAVPLADGDTEIEVTRLNERPYVEMTLQYLDSHGIEYQNHNWQRFTIPGRQAYQPFSARVPGDWSSATFFLVAGAILPGELELTGLDPADTQGDKAVVEMLRAMGAQIEMQQGLIRIRPGRLTGDELDLNATPDALPALAVAACFAQGETRLVNVPQARFKETDRIAVMAQELTKFGADVSELEDGLVIRGGKALHSAAVSGHDDHRVVMALSLAGMAIDGRTEIDTAQAVRITFPQYVDLMRSVGARCDMIP